MVYLITFILVLLSGIFSGLTLGFFSLNLSELERKAKLGNNLAMRTLEVRRDGNLLLCTLLLGNVAVNSTLAIFLGSVASGLIAGILSTTLIVIFGEILPQAVFTRHALVVGAYSVKLVQLFRFLMYPIAGPLSKLLDRILGEELGTVWDKHEIKEIISDHEASPDSSIDKDEERITLGALTFSDRSVREVMTPKTVVYHLDQEQELSEELLNDIRKNGHTRIPVYENHSDNISAILYAKDLLGIRIDKLKIKDLARKEKLIIVQEKMKLDNLLNKLIQEKTHIAIVYDEFGIFNGIVTLEDIIEEILRIEIMDEVDAISDLRDYAKTKFSGNQNKA